MSDAFLGTRFDYHVSDLCRDSLEGDPILQLKKWLEEASSAGIIEAATFGTPVVNVGDRQRLRERNLNVIDVPAQMQPLREAVSAAACAGRFERVNRYGDGFAGERIVNRLLQLPLAPQWLEKVNAN